MIREFYNDSWITHVKHDDETNEMVVTMKGGTKNKYACQGVTLADFEAFRDSGSRGTHFNNEIKGKFLHEWFS
ncbi:KTSC domain-containing protein [Nitrosopumilus sp.]|uniref:KTSC domain-containing protein n=1 Tax=Nitrosopumilus sp. TaxID=2024843 RepID=UPI003D10BD86